MSTDTAAKKTTVKNVKPATEAVPSERFRTFKDLEVHNWNLSNDAKNGRRFINATMKYGDVADWIHAETFQYETLGGWQRELSEPHVANLRKEMESNNFTPTPFSFSINDWHEQNMKTRREGDKTFVDIKVGSDTSHKLAVTDGNHRRNAIRALLEEAEKAGPGANNVNEMKEKLLNLPISFMLHLNHDKLTGDFLNLQKSRPVARNVTKSMEILSGLVEDEEDYPLMRFATDAIIKLNNNTRSHLASSVAFGEASMSEVQYASLVSPGASTLMTTVAGGAKIAMEYGKSADWLMEKYVEMYEALKKYCKPVDQELGEDSVREVFAKDMMLLPVNSVGNKGTRGGSHLLVGVANCYAYVMANRTDGTPTDQDLQWLAEAVDDVFNVDPEESDFGGSAGDKRKWMGMFVRKYFKHAKFNLNADGSSVEYLPFDKKVPAKLVELLSPSTMNINLKEWKAYKNAKAGVTPKKKGRKPKAEAYTQPQLEGATS